MSAAGWVDRENSAVTFQEDKPRASEALQDRERASTQLGRAVRVEAAVSASGNHVTERPPRSEIRTSGAFDDHNGTHLHLSAAAVSASGKHATENLSRSEFRTSGVFDDRNGTHLPRSKQSANMAQSPTFREQQELPGASVTELNTSEAIADDDNRWINSRTQKPAAMRPGANSGIDVMEYRRQHGTLYQRKQPASMAQSPTFREPQLYRLAQAYSETTEEPVQSTITDNHHFAAPMLPAGTRKNGPSKAKVITNGVIRRTVGHQSVVRKGINLTSTVNEVTSRWIQDDPALQGYAQTVRGTVQAVTTASNTVQYGAWAWTTSYKLLKAPVGLIQSVRRVGLLPTLATGFKKAGAAILRLGAALVSKAVIAIILALLLTILIIILPVASLIGAGTDMSFGIPNGGRAIDELYEYCTTLDAQWTVRLREAMNESGYGVMCVNGSPVGGNSSSAMRLIEVAEGEIGCTDAMRYWNYYTDIGGRYYAGSGWCHIFVNYCLGKAGLIESGQAFRQYTLYGSRGDPTTWLNRGQWRSHGEIPESGDIIYFDWNGNMNLQAPQGSTARHVGIVVSCNGSEIEYIDGNNGGKVKRSHVSVTSSKILGFGTPCSAVQGAGGTQSAVSGQSASSGSAGYVVKTNINKLLLYLQVINANGEHSISELKRQIDDLYDAMYSISTSYSTRTVTQSRTVHAGESLGTVVTSAYCNCALCCGQWAGGPTASGVYPTSNHTLAVDAYTPTVPMGTEIIMNGTIYKVEDTGAFSRFGVDFDVYMDSHEEAQGWGHRSFEAFLAGGDGESVQITETRSISVRNVDLHVTSLGQLMRLTEAEKTHMDLIKEFGQYSGYAVAGNPFGQNVHWVVAERYGDYADGTGIAHRESCSVNVASGQRVYAPLDGTLIWSGDTASITKPTPSGEVTITLSGLSSRCGNGTVTAGTLIGTADGELTIRMTRDGQPLNPAIYMANTPGGGDGQTLVDMALTQLGQRGGDPYWRFFGLSAREAWCSMFASWCANECGFLETGIIPKFSYSGDAIQWFREHGQWQGSGYTPNPGDLMFFDWDGDGLPDHTGIVASCDGTTVYTVEGNIGDAVVQQHHAVSSSTIIGYGTPEYS